MTTKLDVYNGACAHLKVRRLSSLDDMRSSRLALDRVWDEAVRTCLASAAWTFAIHRGPLHQDPKLFAEGGYAFAFRKPRGWLRTVSLSTAEDFGVHILYEDGPEYIYADFEPLHAQWVSEVEPDVWTDGFVAYLEARLASCVVSELPYRGITRAGIEALASELRADAALTEALAVNPQRRIWRPSRTRGDGGSTVRLIG